MDCSTIKCYDSDHDLHPCPQDDLHSALSNWAFSPPPPPFPGVLRDRVVGGATPGVYVVNLVITTKISFV